MTRFGPVKLPSSLLIARSYSSVPSSYGSGRKSFMPAVLVSEQGIFSMPSTVTSPEAARFIVNWTIAVSLSRGLVFPPKTKLPSE